MLRRWVFGVGSFSSAGNKSVQRIKTFSVKLANDTDKKSVARTKEVARVTKRFVPCFVSVIASRARDYAHVTRLNALLPCTRSARVHGLSCMAFIDFCLSP